MNSMTIAMAHSTKLPAGFSTGLARRAIAVSLALSSAGLLGGCADEPAPRPMVRHTQQGSIQGQGQVPKPSSMAGAAKSLASTPGTAKKQVPAGTAPAAAGQPSQTAAAGPAAPAKSNDPQARFEAVLAMLDQHDQDQAEPELVSLVHDFPQLSGPATELGLLYLRSNRKQQAGQAFDQALRANPNNTVALNCLGILYRQGGDFAHAEQVYLRAIALKPDDAKTHLNLGILYELSMRRPQDALVQYREYQKYAPKENLVVSAWIKELEPQPAKPVAAGPTSASGTITAAR